MSLVKHFRQTREIPLEGWRIKWQRTEEGFLCAPKCRAHVSEGLMERVTILDERNQAHNVRSRTEVKQSGFVGMKVPNKT